jgi:hypothetical protein
MTVVVRLESCIIFRLSDKIPELTSPRGIVTPAKLAERNAARDALPIGSRHLVKPLALYQLVAHRCPDCRHDSVLENRTDWRDLDDTDYGDEGSWP